MNNDLEFGEGFSVLADVDCALAELSVEGPIGWWRQVSDVRFEQAQFERRKKLG